MSTPDGVFDVTFAFQPIVDIELRTVFAQEALVRGHLRESAGSIFSALDPKLLHSFDGAARIQAIKLAAKLGITGSLSLNFLPRSLETYPEAISDTLEAARAAGIAESNLILEVSEGELIQDPEGFAETINHYRSSGLRLAIDDFGAGYAGLNLLADFQPDVIKIDMRLVRSIDNEGPRQAIARGVVQVCGDLGIAVVAEGVETEAEFHWFAKAGVTLFQGYYLARPAFEALHLPAMLMS